MQMKQRMPSIQTGWTGRSERNCEKGIPRKVYQRKKALMSRPGMVLSRLRLLLFGAVVAVIRIPPLRSGGPLRREQTG